jgi:hypothetical protein
MATQAKAVPGEDLRRAFREKHGVRLVTAEEEGTGLHRLPNGVFGYTYAPGLDQAPLFQEYRYQAFETHKLADGTVVLIGFVTPAEAAQIEAFEAIRFRLLPAPSDEAQTAVALPLWRIQRHREHSTRDGKGFEVDLIGGKA